MYLSRVFLPLLQPSSHAILADVHALHRTLMSAFPTPAGRVLFRVEPAQPRSPASEAAILVQSEQLPRWIGIQPLRVVENVKRVSFEFESGSIFQFRLRANPTVKKRREEQRNGARLAILGEDRQVAWLSNKGKYGGFMLRQCRVKDEKTVSGVKTEGHDLSFRSVLFEGTLIVTDPPRFREAAASGIGSAKAFGFGLLSLAPVSGSPHELS